MANIYISHLVHITGQSVRHIFIRRQYFIKIQLRSHDVTWDIDVMAPYVCHCDSAVQTGHDQMDQSNFLLLWKIENSTDMMTPSMEMFSVLLALCAGNR